MRPLKKNVQRMEHYIIIVLVITMISTRTWILNVTLENWAKFVIQILKLTVLLPKSRFNQNMLQSMFLRLMILSSHYQILVYLIVLTLRIVKILVIVELGAICMKVIVISLPHLKPNAILEAILRLMEKLLWILIMSIQ